MHDIESTRTKTSDSHMTRSHTQHCYIVTLDPFPLAVFGERLACHNCQTMIHACHIPQHLAITVCHQQTSCPSLLRHQYWHRRLDGIIFSDSNCFSYTWSHHALEQAIRTAVYATTRGGKEVCTQDKCTVALTGSALIHTRKY